MLRRLQIKEVQAGHTDLVNQIFYGVFTQVVVHAY